MNRHSNSATIVVALSLALSVGCSRTPQSAEPGAVASQRAPEPAPVAPAEKPKSYDGPFGLVSGLKLAEIQRLVPDLVHDAGTVYTSKTLPTPHPSFETYQLQISEKSGLCKIGAVTKDIESGGMGSEVRTEFAALDDALTAKYGTGKKYDFASGIMEDPKYWMIALSRLDRKYAKIWQPSDGSTLPASISGIQIQAGATDSTTGYIVLKYEFANSKDCTAEEAAFQNKAL